MPRHITAFYICIVLNFIVLFEVVQVDGKINVFKQDGDIVDSFRDREASFGAELNNIIEGIIVAANPPDACKRIDEPQFFTNFTISKFVLINGSVSERCTSATKVKNAARAGFDVVVIFDASPSYFESIRIGPELSIPAVLISWEDGLIILNDYQYNSSLVENYILEIIPNSQDISYYIMLFAVVIGVCFIVMVLFMICLLVKCIQERRRSRRNRLSNRQIKQIPSAKFSKGDQFDVCAICLEDYNEGDKLRILPCSHAYHARCIDPWLMNNRRNCPLCKRKVTFGDSSSDSDTDSELASPAENTPLISSPAVHSWGTFTQNSTNPLDGTDGRQSIVHPQTSQYAANSTYDGCTNVGVCTETSDDENFPSANCSVNNSDAEEIVDYTSYTILQEPSASTVDTHNGLIV